jgi:phosphoribosylformylglycinamidine cyclo-ligase
MINYQSAGVNIESNHEIVRRVSNHLGPQVLGGFAGLYDLKTIVHNYEEPLLVQSMDGVGTKTLIASMMQQYDTLGEDLLSATANDILVYGATPLTLVDYVGGGCLRPDEVVAIINSIGHACQKNQVELLGGDTAEMPGMYTTNGYTLVGVITGVVDKKQLITGHHIQPGDTVLGFASSGLHTNGYSLARKLCFEVAHLSPSSIVPELQTPTLGDALLTPHRNYAHCVQTLLKHHSIKGMAHITGGGLLDNIARILPQNCNAILNTTAWPSLPIFDYLTRLGSLNTKEAYRTFNMGIGFILIADKKTAPELLAHATETAYPLYEIGEVIAGTQQVMLE